MLRPIPLDVPTEIQGSYITRLEQTHNMAGRTCLLSCDHLIEHLYDDFLPEHNTSGRADPRYFFELADSLHPELFAVPFGLLIRCASEYPTLPYVVKVTAKTNANTVIDPYAAHIVSIDQVCRIRDAGIQIVGVGATIYVGSKHEARMLEAAARIIDHAHTEGFLVILWIYARSKHIENDRDGARIAGCAGLANNLGADFVKIKAPKCTTDEETLTWLSRACTIADSTRVLISGGPTRTSKELLHEITLWIQAGARGIAVGRNIFQRPPAQAMELYTEIQHILLTKKSEEPYHT